MKRTIEFLASVEIEVANPAHMAEATRTAQRILERAGASGPGVQFTVGPVVAMTREQSRAVRMVTAAAKNGGSVPQTMDEVAEGGRAILGHSTRQMDIGAKNDSMSNVATWFVADSR